MAIVIVLGAVIIIGVADLHRRHEQVLLANLGLSRATLVGLFAVPALLGEILIGLAVEVRT